MAAGSPAGITFSRSSASSGRTGPACTTSCGWRGTGGSWPSRTKYLLLVFGFLRRLLELHLEFVDDLERELEG